MDFVSDALANGRALGALTVGDNFTKEVPAIEVGVSVSAPRVTRVLEEMIGAMRLIYPFRAINAAGRASLPVSQDQPEIQQPFCASLAPGVVLWFAH
jgi:hypothetical protein